jgi:hypothetical protein
MYQPLKSPLKSRDNEPDGPYGLEKYSAQIGEPLVKKFQLTTTSTRRASRNRRSGAHASNAFE